MTGLCSPALGLGAGWARMISLGMAILVLTRLGAGAFTEELILGSGTQQHNSTDDCGVIVHHHVSLLLTCRNTVNHTNVVRPCCDVLHQEGNPGWTVTMQAHGLDVGDISPAGLEYGVGYQFTATPSSELNLLDNNGIYTRKAWFNSWGELRSVAALEDYYSTTYLDQHPDIHAMLVFGNFWPHADGVSILDTPLRNNMGLMQIYVILVGTDDTEKKTMLQVKVNEMISPSIRAVHQKWTAADYSSEVTQPRKIVIQIAGAGWVFFRSVSVVIPKDCDVGYSRANITDTCVMCSPGEAPSGNGCQQCPVGTFSATSASPECTLCPKGSHQPLTGQSSCIPCEPGYVARFPGQAVCTPCLKGYISAGYGAFECSACWSGSSTEGSIAYSKCVNCPAGTFSDHEAAHECTACPENSISAIGSADLSSCLCETGFYGQPTKGQDCVPCVRNTKCPRGSTYPSAIPGYWMSKSNPDSVLKCVPMSVCPGGEESCSEGATGDACSDCLEGYYRAADGCLKCPEDGSIVGRLTSICLGGLTTAAICLCFCTYPLYDRLCSDRFRLVKKLTTFVRSQGKVMMRIWAIQSSSCQTLSLALTLNFSLPAVTIGLFKFISLFTLNTNIVMPYQCFSGSDLVFSVIYWIKAVVFPLLVASGVMVTAMLSWTFNPAQSTPSDANKKSRPSSCSTRMKESIQHGLGGIFMLTNMFYSLLMSVAVQPFRCEVVSSSQFRLVSDPSIMCSLNHKAYVSILPAAVVLSFVYMVAWPIMIITVMTCNRSTELRSRPPVQRMFGFLWTPYSQRLYYWEIVNILRKLWVVFVLIVGFGSAEEQLLGIILQVVVGLTLNGLFGPYRERIDDFVLVTSELSVASCTIVVFILLALDDGATDNYDSLAVMWGVIIVGIVACQALLTMVMLLIKLFNLETRIVTRFPSVFGGDGDYPVVEGGDVSGPESDVNSETPLKDINPFTQKMPPSSVNEKITSSETTSPAKTADSQRASMQEGVDTTRPRPGGVRQHGAPNAVKPPRPPNSVNSARTTSAETTSPRGVAAGSRNGAHIDHGATTAHRQRAPIQGGTTSPRGVAAGSRNGAHIDHGATTAHRQRAPIQGGMGAGTRPTSKATVAPARAPFGNAVGNTKATVSALKAKGMALF